RRHTRSDRDWSSDVCSSDLSSEELAFLRAGGTVSVAATLRTMARSGDGKLALVELKAVDDNYPMLGQLTLAPDLSMRDLLAEREIGRASCREGGWVWVGEGG